MQGLLLKIIVSLLGFGLLTGMPKADIRHEVDPMMAAVGNLHGALVMPAMTPWLTPGGQASLQ